MAVDFLGLLADAMGQGSAQPPQQFGGLLGTGGQAAPGPVGLLSVSDDGPPDVFEQAKEQFAVLRGLDIDFKRSPGRSGEILEFWPADEPGSPDRPRPADFPLDRVGIEVFDDNTRPIDVMGDVASHHLIETDPRVRSVYQRFRGSLTDNQRQRLRAQYQHSVQNFGERRSFEEWREMNGLPAYFRGYAFQQWDNPEDLYTQGQIEMFDDMMQYLRTGE